MAGPAERSTVPDARADGTRPVPRAAWLSLGLVALLTASGYAALWPLQRSLFLAGLDPQNPLAFPRVAPDPEAAQQAFLLVVLVGVGLVLLALCLVLLCRRWTSPWFTRAALALPAAVAVALWLVPPTLSIDAYSYLAHGRLAADGGDPYATPAADVGGTPYGRALGLAGWMPVHPQTPYGPLWTLVERLVALVAGDDVTLGVLLIKLPALLATLGTAVVLFRMQRELRPERRATGTLLWLANPLVLVEFAGEGHNDAVALLLLTLATLGCVRRTPLLAIVALGAAVLTKATPAVFALPMAVQLIARRRSGRRLLVESAVGLVAVAALAVAAYAPYWRGLDTFTGMGATATPGPTWSVAGWLLGVLSPDPLADPAAVTAPVLLVLTALLLVGAVAAAAGARTVRGLVVGCAALSLLTLLLLPVYWSWYGALPLPFLALLAGWSDTATAGLLALGSRIVAAMADLAAIGVIGYDVVWQQQPLIGQTLPAALGLLLVAAHLVRRGWPKDRTAAPERASPARAETPPIQ